MMAGASHPMGPLTLADFVGLDTLASIADVMVDAYGEERFAQPDTLRKLVEAGHYGRKSGRGFYDYSGEKPVAADPSAKRRTPSSLPGLDRPPVRREEASLDAHSIDRIRNATFSHAVRGYDRHEVDQFLGELADWLERDGDEDALRQRVRAELERIGEQIADDPHRGPRRRAGRSARRRRAEVAPEPRARPTSTAESLRSAAPTSTRTRRARRPTLHARKARPTPTPMPSRPARGGGCARASRGRARGRAEREAERIIEEANRRKRDIESVISDLEERRDAVLAELERLASGITGTATQHRSEGSTAREATTNPATPPAPASTQPRLGVRLFARFADACGRGAASAAHAGNQEGSQHARGDRANPSGRVHLGGRLRPSRFALSRRGYDRDEVDAFLSELGRQPRADRGRARGYGATKRLARRSVASSS